MEKVKKYTKFFDLLIIDHNFDNSPLVDLGKRYFRTLRTITHSEEILEELSCHILIIGGTVAEISDKHTRTQISKIQRIDTFILSDDASNIDLYKEALIHRAGFVGKKVNNEDEFAAVLMSMLPHIIKKHNESLAVANHKLIVEKSSHHYWIVRGKKGIFANQAFKQFYGFTDLATFDQSEAAQNLRELHGSKILELTSSAQESQTFLVTSEKTNESEHLIEMSPIQGDLLLAKNSFLNRISFIELIKDAFVIHKQEDEAIPVVIITVENESKIIEEFGEDIYSDICNEILQMAKSHFNSMSNIALWHKDVFTIIDERATLDELKSSLERLHQNIVAQVSVQGVTPILDSFVIDMSKLELNKAIMIIDNIKNRELVLSDLSHLVYHEVYFDNNDHDIKDQALHYLEKLFLSKSQIKLLSFYKGIRINTIGQIIKMSDGIAYISIEKIQGYAMKLEENVVVQATNLPFDIAAEIKIIDIGRKIAVLHNFKPLKVSANNRQHIRIQSDHRMHVTINALKSVISATIQDISIKSIACRVNNAKGIPEKGTLVTLRFHLPSKRFDEGVVSMLITGRLEFIQEADGYTKVVVILDLEEPYEGFLIEYLYARQQELVSEIKSIVSKL